MMKPVVPLPPIVGQDLIGRQAKTERGIGLTDNGERLGVNKVQRNLSDLFTYLPKWQDRQICLLPC
jgi:hypothetical protein